MPAPSPVFRPLLSQTLPRTIESLFMTMPSSVFALDEHDSINEPAPQSMPLAPLLRAVQERMVDAPEHAMPLAVLARATTCSMTAPVEMEMPSPVLSEAVMWSSVQPSPTCRPPPPLDVTSRSVKRPLSALAALMPAPLQLAMRPLRTV